jgi:hypothetical protein
VDFGLFSLAFMVCFFRSNLHRSQFTQSLNVLGVSGERERLSRRFASLSRLQPLAIPLAAHVVVFAAWFAFQSAALVAALSLATTMAFQAGFVALRARRLRG